jgi:hypothetical protein
MPCATARPRSPYARCHSWSIDSEGTHASDSFDVAENRLEEFPERTMTPEKTYSLVEKGFGSQSGRVLSGSCCPIASTATICAVPLDCVAGSAWMTSLSRR